MRVLVMVDVDVVVVVVVVLPEFVAYRPKPAAAIIISTMAVRANMVVDTAVLLVSVFIVNDDFFSLFSPMP
jgi:hypothetical protein